MKKRARFRKLRFAPLPANNDSSRPATPQVPLLDKFLELKLNEQGLVLATLCYLLGFLIVNLHLGALGVTSFDVLRTRYVLVGFMFLVFLAIIVYALFGVLHIIFRDESKSAGTILGEIWIFSLETWAVVWIGIWVLSLVAGSTDSPPVGTPNLSPVVSIGHWFEEAPLRIFDIYIQLLRGLLTFTWWTYPVYVVFFLLFLISIMRKTLRQSGLQGKWQTTKNLARNLVASLRKPKLLRRSLTIFLHFGLFVPVVLSLVSLLLFVSTNRVITDVNFAFSDRGWQRFLLASFLIYAIPTALFFWGLIFDRGGLIGKGSDRTVNTLASKYLPWVVLTIVLISVVPVYALGVYPLIPQQVGGGKVIQVKVASANSGIARIVSDPNSNVYIIDRTSTDTFFLISSRVLTQSQNIQATRVIQVPNTQISTVDYKSP